MNINPNASKPVLICAIGILAAFFMPWVQFFGLGISGYNLGRIGSYGNYAWVVPVLSGAVVLVTFAGLKNRLLGAIAGVIPLCMIGYIIFQYVNSGKIQNADVVNVATQVLSIGAWLTVILSVAIIVISFLPVMPVQQAHRVE